MSPYRTPPAQQAPPLREPEEVKLWQAMRDQFGHLADDETWPTPKERPFEPRGLDALAVSGDGRRALLAAGHQAWLLDIETMRATALPALPERMSFALLDDSGARAVALCEPWLYTCELTEQPDRVQPEWSQIWPLESTWDVEYRSLSRDGRLLVTAADSSEATVRIFDLDARTLVYHFGADCDEGIAVHPDGRHIACFADSGQALIMGQSGRDRVINRTGGGAFSRDGQWLLRNDLDADDTLVITSIDASSEKMRVGRRREIKTHFKIRSWGLRMRFTPNGQRALIEDTEHNAQLVDLESGQSIALRVPMAPGGGILADSRHALMGPVSYNGGGMFECRVGMLIDADQARFQGALASARRDGNDAGELALVGATRLGFYGALDTDEQPLSAEPDRPYERCGAIRSLLRGTADHSLSVDEQRAMNEVVTREQAWQRYRRQMTVDIDTRQLMAINRGLSYLTPEIVKRAQERGLLTPHFGSPQLTLQALAAAGDELRALTPAERAQVFAAMLERLRARDRSSRTRVRSVVAGPEVTVTAGAPRDNQLDVHRSARSDALADNPDTSLALREASALSLEPETDSQTSSALVAPASDDLADDLVRADDRALAHQRSSYALPVVGTLLAILAAIAGFLFL